jgi:enhancing lycopene biosynthesis protein 2
MPKIAVVLSGCGVNDGAELHEAVITLLALDRAGVEIVCAAPDIPQAHVINHVTGEPTGETRNVLVESARIARGKIKNLAQLGAGDVDAAIFVGGFGAAKNLTGWAFQGDAGEVEPEVARFIRDLRAAGKPMGFMCIAPVIAAKVIPGAMLTIGNDRETAASIEKMGGKHQACSVSDIVIDRERKLVSTPAYMLATGPAQAATGIERLCKAVIELC